MQSKFNKFVKTMMSYVEQTKRQFKTKIKEHVTNIKLDSSKIFATFQKTFLNIS